MRRLLTALLVALMVAGMLPLTAFAGVPTADDTSATADEDTAVASCSRRPRTPAPR